MKQATDPEGHGTFVDYGDEYGANAWANTHLIQTGAVSTANRRTTTYEYDNYGRVRKVIDPASDSTLAAYNLVNWTDSTTNAAREVTRYAYHANGTLYRVTDAKHQTYTFHRNALGWLESEVDPRGQSMYYGYDRNGNQTSHTNRRNQTITAGYDALDRIISRSQQAEGQQTTWSYGTHTESDRWMQVQNSVSTDRVDFDPTGRPTQATTTRGGTTYTLESRYNERDLRTEVRLTSPWSSSVGYRYNARMQLDTLIDRMGGKTTLTYNDDGQEIRRTLPTGLNIYRDYPSTHITALIRYGNSTLQEALGVGYSHNKKGLIGARKERYTNLLGSGDLVREYGYDNLSRLTGYTDTEHPDGSSTCSGTELQDPDGGTCVPSGGTYAGGDSYRYDAVGNRLDRSAAYEPGSNRLTYFNGYTLGYDADGNLTSKSKPGFTQTFTWNSLGQLTQTTTNGQTVSYGYDGFGRWARYTHPNTTIQYVWDGDDLFLEQDASGAVTEYTYYPGIDQPHSIKRGSSIHYYATDFPGNVVGLIGGQNELANEYRYFPFGEREYVEETVGNALQFQARHYDPASQLYAWRARWYDPSLARFISEDPIGLEGGINPYVFAENNPVNFTDPYGLETCTWVVTSVVIDGKQSEGYGQWVCKGGGSGWSTPLSCRGPCPTPSGPGSTPPAGPREGGSGGTTPRGRPAGTPPAQEPVPTIRPGTCSADVGQLAVNAGAHALGVGFFRGASAGYTYMSALRNGVQPSAATVRAVAVNATFLPGATAFRRGMEAHGGTQVGSGWGGFFYGSAKLVPFASLGIDAFEVGVSCFGWFQ